MDKDNFQAKFELLDLLSETADNIAKLSGMMIYENESESLELTDQLLVRQLRVEINFFRIFLSVLKKYRTDFDNDEGKRLISEMVGRAGENNPREVNDINELIELIEYRIVRDKRDFTFLKAGEPIPEVVH